MHITRKNLTQSDDLIYKNVRAKMDSSTFNNIHRHIKHNTTIPTTDVPSRARRAEISRGIRAPKSSV